MKYRILPVKNVSRMRDAGDALINRSLGMPGMGLIWGPTGYGKTTAATWFINQCHGVYIRAMRLWSPKSMLAAMARELDIEVKYCTNGDMVERIIQRLAETGRPLFIDEADYIVESRRLTDTLRDIHDLSTVPVILIGMHGIEKRIRNNEQFTGRISQWVAFEGIDIHDARLLADGLTDISISNDLLAQLHQQATPKRGKSPSGAEVRRMVVGLGRLEQHAKSRGLVSLTPEQLPPDFDFFIGSAVAREMPARTVSQLRGVE